MYVLTEKTYDFNKCCTFCTYCKSMLHTRIIFICRTFDFVLLGYMQLLSQLTSIGDVSKKLFNGMYCI